MASPTGPQAHPVSYDTPAGRWVLAAAVLGSGMAFLDATVVNVALPAIGGDLDAGLSGLQWTLDAYLVTLSALLLLGGSLGDRYGRRRLYVAGLAAFTAASLLCGLAPTTGALIAARALQGVGGALLVPGSLAIISATFAAEDRGRAIGAWSALAGVGTAVGPLAGGWLVEAVSWRLVFLINLPIAAVAVAVTLRHVPESRGAATTCPPDVGGALAATLGLGALSYALIEAGSEGASPAVVTTGGIGLFALVAFVAVERRHPEPMLPLALFRSAQFSGANVTTLGVYAALSGATFLLVLALQLGLGYSALEAGASLLPITVLMLVLSPRAGQLAGRVGPRLPMTAGPLLVAGGLLLLTRVAAGRPYVGTVLPALVILGGGLALTVAPLTSAVLAAVADSHVGVASGVNNAVARVAGLLAVAVLPAVVGLDLAEAGTGGGGLGAGFRSAMVIAAGSCVVGAVVAFATVRTSTPVVALRQPGVVQPCHDPAAREGRPPAA